MEILATMLATCLLMIAAALGITSHRKELATGNPGWGYWGMFWLIVGGGGVGWYYMDHPFVFLVMGSIVAMVVPFAIVYFAVESWQTWRQPDQRQEDSDQ